jgi:hypothetical protein
VSPREGCAFPLSLREAIAQNAVIQTPSGAKRVFDCLAALVEDVGALLYAGLLS